MRALHPLAPVGRWQHLATDVQDAAIGNGWAVLRHMERNDGWWELGAAVSLVRYKPPGYRKPWVCMAVQCREKVPLDYPLPDTARERQRRHRLALL